MFFFRGLFKMDSSENIGMSVIALYNTYHNIQLSHKNVSYLFITNKIFIKDPTRSELLWGLRL